MCAIKAERVRRVVLPGVRTCSPFEEGVLRMDGWVVHALGGGPKGARGGQPARLPLTTGADLLDDAAPRDGRS